MEKTVRHVSLVAVSSHTVNPSFYKPLCCGQRTERGWREVLVDIDPEKPEQLRFVVTPAPTLASSTLVQVNLLGFGDCCRCQ